MSELFDTTPFAYVGNNKHYKDLTAEEKEELKKSTKRVEKEELPSSAEVEESSASVVGQMLPQVELTENEEPSLDDLMADVDEESELLNESLKDEINGVEIYFENGSLFEKLKSKLRRNKDPENKIDNNKVTKTAKAYTAMKMSASRLKIAVTKNPDIKGTPEHKELQKKAIIAEKEFRKLKKTLNNDELAYINEFSSGFDSTFDKTVERHIKAILEAQKAAIKTESVVYASDEEYDIFTEAVGEVTAGLIAGGITLAVYGLAMIPVVKIINSTKKLVNQCTDILKETDSKFIDPKDMTITKYKVKKCYDALERSDKIDDKNKLKKLLQSLGDTIDVYCCDGKEIFSISKVTELVGGGFGSTSNGKAVSTVNYTKKIAFNMIDKSLDKYKMYYLSYANIKYGYQTTEAVNWCKDFIEKNEKKEDVKKESVETQMITEKGIDSDMKPIIEKLNKKGYKTQSSSSGNNKLVAKDDHTENGVRDGRLYSDARLVFDGKYNLGKAPEYWYWKKVDNADDVEYLDIEEIKYDTTPGGPSKAFQDWKIKYMNSLKDWVDSLPDISGDKKEDKGDVEEACHTESVEDIESDINILFESVMGDLEFDIANL